MSEAKSGACSGANTLIFSCSGAADVGEVAPKSYAKSDHYATLASLKNDP